MSKLVLQADRFAAAAHSAIDHRRKYSGEPYIEHPREVAQLVASVTNDEQVIAAALLHDTVEDTPVTLEQIESEFGRRIAVLVEQLTDVSRPEDGNRRARKALDLAHTAKASPEAKTVKLADLISNTRSIVAHDPDFARVYLAEKARLLEVLTEGDAGLFAQASLLLTESLQRLADQKMTRSTSQIEYLPGGDLMIALDRQRTLKGHTMHQLAEVLDVSYGYLQQLRTGFKPIPKISDELTHRCARYLEIARIQVLLMAGRINEADFFLDGSAQRDRALALRLVASSSYAIQCGATLAMLESASLECQDLIIALHREARSGTSGR